MAISTTVIICTRNRIKDVTTCLASLAVQKDPAQELIIVDSSDTAIDCDPDFQKQFCKNIFPNTELHYVHTKPGLTYQRNVGIKHARGDIIYFFDDDVILDKTYLHEMNKIFLEHPKYVGGMGTIRNIKKDVSWKYQLFRRLFLLSREQSSGMFTWSGMPTHPYGTETFRPVEVLGGCCMAFRKDTLAYHKFDEQFQGYCYMEDCDISRRIAYERPLFFNPKARLQHLESPMARDRIVDNSAMFVRNYRHLFFKNFYRKNRLRIFAYYWSVCGLFVEALLLRDWQRVRGYWRGLVSKNKIIK